MNDTAARRLGDDYIVTKEELDCFRRDGYVHLRGVMSESEMKVIDDAYDAFLQKRVAVDGRDFNDMTTGEFGTDPSSYAIVNVMLPRKYLPSLQGNLFERRAASIARQLCGEGMVIDFDQLLAKQPFRNDAVFAWHQDQRIGSTRPTAAPPRAGWQSTTRPLRTAACSSCLARSTNRAPAPPAARRSRREPHARHRPAPGGADDPG